MSRVPSNYWHWSIFRLRIFLQIWIQKQQNTMQHLRIRDNLERRWRSGHLLLRKETRELKIASYAQPSQKTDSILKMHLSERFQETRRARAKTLRRPILQKRIDNLMSYGLLGLWLQIDSPIVVVNLLVLSFIIQINLNILINQQTLPCPFAGTTVCCGCI